MAKIGGWHIKTVPANPGETVLASYPANQLRRDARPLGGKLYLTSDRVVFTPHLIDAWLGGASHELALLDILSVDRYSPAEDDTYGGGDEPRIRIETTEDEAMFIVKNLANAVETIDNAVAERVTESAE